MKFHVMFHPRLIYILNIKEEEQTYETFRYKLYLPHNVLFQFLTEKGIDPAMPQPTKLTVGGML